ncbi:DUF6192 family protein [Streptomyces sp. ME01-18a]|uniref:DUF6192 family protein n=1 Tax=Streptomyces sp. ME01-18a TaxID=3028669 RepID=UPI0029B0B2EB|nr:DUF6192 family protein [Streptomyces sp. ME01-18a]MDX3434233.1 DUF6192 family protein [Streptomyces sp. ME01-18a]
MAASRATPSDDKVTVKDTVSLLSRAETAANPLASDRIKGIKKLTRDHEVATSVTSELPQSQRRTSDIAQRRNRFTVIRAQFDNSMGAGSGHASRPCGVPVVP